MIFGILGKQMDENIKQLIKSSAKVVGMKQVLRCVIEGDNIRCVVLARNADDVIINKVLSAVRDKNISLLYCDDMVELGQVCKIDVSAAVVGLLE